MASYIREKPVPAYIKEKIQQLKAHQETIEHLKNRIAIEREACHQLEKELELYHASVAPIRNCPPEILSMFFEYYVAENPRLIRRLLLVCRLWHRIAINTPQFWTTIKVSFNSTLIKATNQSNSRFIKACLEHSAESLLHVDVDFRAEDVWALDWSEVRTFFLETELHMPRTFFFYADKAGIHTSHRNARFTYVEMENGVHLAPRR